LPHWIPSNLQIESSAAFYPVPQKSRAAALLIVKRYGDDAMLEAAERADQLLDEGETWPGTETWHRILNAIERLQAKAPAEKVH
jgi:hypothetical protein